MNKLAFVLLLTLASTAVYATPEFIAKSNVGDITSGYADSLVVSGKTRQLWFITELRNPFVRDDVTIRSYKYQAAFDCKGKRISILLAAYYDGKKGTGNLVMSHETPTKLMAATPDTMDSAILNYACALQSN